MGARQPDNHPEIPRQTEKKTEDDIEMTNTATAANMAGNSGEKEKEKEKPIRRALGRGLASLLPGPRVVTPSPTNISTVPPAPTAAPPPAPLRTTPPSGPGVAVEPTAAAFASAATAAPASASSRTGGEDQTRPGIRTHELEPYTGWPAGEGSAIPLEGAAETRIPGNLVFNLAIADIDKNPFQTRYVADDHALEELANSIQVNGVVQPIVVRPAEDGDGRYTLILGERRLHASKKVGKTHIPALVRKVSTQQAAEMTIIENLQREDLSPMEQAQAFKVLSTEFNLTQQQIAERVGLSRESISNYMRLLKLPREVMQMLAEKRITFAKAKELLKLGDNDRIADAALYAVKKGMNLEQIEMLVLRMDGLADPLPDMPGVEKNKSGGARWVDPNVRAAQMDLERTLGLRVRIRDRKGKGKIVIEYATVDDYERVVSALRGEK